jgi:hypothetical protein
MTGGPETSGWPDRKRSLPGFGHLAARQEAIGGHQREDLVSAEQDRSPCLRIRRVVTRRFRNARQERRLVGVIGCERGERPAEIVFCRPRKSVLPVAHVHETGIAGEDLFLGAPLRRPVVEFGARRAHGTEAGLYAARAAYLGDCEATSNVEAGLRFDIPLSGTMAHSWVMAFGDEATAFRRYAEVFGGRAVLLLDTYDTLGAARVAAASGLTPAAVRLDSGDMVALSRAVRDILDAAGLQQTKIFASGNLDEWRIAEIVAVGAPVDAFGVGAALSTSSDAPSLGGVYKLVEIERGPRRLPP